MPVSPSTVASPAPPARSYDEGPLARPLDVFRRRPTLPGGCPPSTIGAGGLNCSVRNGKRCTPAAITAEIVGRRNARTLKTP